MYADNKMTKSQTLEPTFQIKIFIKISKGLRDIEGHIQQLIPLSVVVFLILPEDIILLIITISRAT